MRKFVLLIAFCLFLMPVAALADNVDFATSSGTVGGFWSYGGTGFTLSGNTVDLPITVSTTGGPTFGLSGSQIIWDSGVSSGPLGFLAAVFGSGGSMTVTQDSSTCSADCFTGTFYGGQLLDGGAGSFVFESAFVSGNLDPSLLAALGLPTIPTGYTGQFSVNLTEGSCIGANAVSIDTICGTFSSADLSLNSPVPEPGSLALFGSGLLGMAGYLRRKLMSR